MERVVAMGLTIANGADRCIVNSRLALIEEQRELADAWRPDWLPPEGPLAIAGCFVCFEGETGFAAAACEGVSAVATGPVTAAYESGLLALRELDLLAAAVRGLPSSPDALLVNATGRDHPRRAGLALHLGAVLALPTAGVTHRPLVAAGEWPRDERGATSPLLLEGDLVGYWVRTRRGTRPLAVHAAWRTDADAAVELVLLSVRRARTPEPIREARTVAREARAQRCR
jgi:deoxyribonuclease V